MKMLKPPEIVFNPKYQPLFAADSPCRYFVVSGGRGSGKSFAIPSAQTILINAREKRTSTLYLRQTLVSAHLSIIPEFWEKVELLGLADNFERTKTELISRRNGSTIYFRGIQAASGSNEANLKSIHNVSTVIIDEAQETSEEEFDRINLSVRSLDVPNRVILSLNPTADLDHWIHRRFFADAGVPDDFNGVKGNVCYIHTTYLDNYNNLPQSFLDEAENDRINRPVKYRNVWLGYWGGEKANALWKSATMIDPYRVASIDPAELDRIVVAIDPAVTSGAKSDETGIVVVGVKTARSGGDNQYFVLEDCSLRGTPNEWANAALQLYWFYSADRIVAEVNNGGDMVEAIIRDSDPTASFKAVRASRGKLVRAEPVAALYERGLVHHVGHLGRLEEQMCSYSGADGEKSPDRMDALVWGITSLAGLGTPQRAVTREFIGTY